MERIVCVFVCVCACVHVYTCRSERNTSSAAAEGLLGEVTFELSCDVEEEPAMGRWEGDISLTQSTISAKNLS